MARRTAAGQRPLFLEAARAAGLQTGLSIGAAIVPVMVGSSIRAAAVAQALFRTG